MGEMLQSRNTNQISFWKLNCSVVSVGHQIIYSFVTIVSEMRHGRLYLGTVPQDDFNWFVVTCISYLIPSIHYS